MLSRRARPTLRTLREDLTNGWESPYPPRQLSIGNYEELHPLADLPHPIITKAAASFPEEAADDNYVGRIQSCSSLTLLEVKAGQWRGGVWIDDAGTCWLLIAGLAKGDHEDHDDFYERIARIEADGPGIAALRPTDEDIRLHKREAVSAAMQQWDLDTQVTLTEQLHSVQDGGTTRAVIRHPLADRLPPSEQTFAEVRLTMTPVRDDDYEADEIDLEILTSSRWAGSGLEWQFILRALSVLNPPEQSWDRVGNTFSTIAEPGDYVHRVRELDQLNAQQELAQSQPGQHAHYTHRRGLTESTYNGSAVRALCGVVFVPMQDHVDMPSCPTCQQRYQQLGAVHA
ncbi:DUF3039 domain-containing protein [Amycolatopsis sp. ATCC 39116]|uniref:DUF3039 domain-containing protein n=1 Tax=Amycolatopsis sp. (strain ATCC 39116 / 75iv2) TaxID=385957 RepID=UPI0002625D0D|nr:DUF3039 domain-containing protein [Amycolatopsis sp. ATCC 39116]